MPSTITPYFVTSFLMNPSPSFKDNFSKQSGIYVKYRPTYPDALYTFLAGLTPAHELVWDCGTGNGQAAIALAAHYDKVIATDPSAQQIANAFPHPRVQYLVEVAEQSSLPAHSADIITIANALHWFNFEVFYAEARRVLKPGGIIAAWSYGTPTVCTEVDEVVSHYDKITLDNYWRPENRLVDKGYTTIPFPFEEVEVPSYILQREMNLDDLVGYLNTWSATQRYINEHNTNPTDAIRAQLEKVWGNPAIPKVVSWKLVLKAGRVGA